MITAITAEVGKSCPFCRKKTTELTEYPVLRAEPELIRDAYCKCRTCGVVFTAGGQYPQQMVA